MYVSYNWLKNYVDLGNISPFYLGEKITKSGIEIEGIEYIGEAIDNLVVGHVLTCEKHPDAEKLNICSVDVGAETLQIICGAPNIEAGQKVVVAKEGAVMPDGLVIWAGRLHKADSHGMICSAKELQLESAPKKRGILVLDEDTQVGEAFQF